MLGRWSVPCRAQSPRHRAPPVQPAVQIDRGAPPRRASRARRGRPLRDAGRHLALHLRPALGTDTTRFSTTDASGSTSQVASLADALDRLAELLELLGTVGRPTLDEAITALCDRLDGQSLESPSPHHGHPGLSPRPQSASPRAASPRPAARPRR
ncbi:P-loop domain-containing protein [Brachybacterium nesterenkovii]|uniref:P-loop domain-containing protein n=1 Tax=Brachybacterium nesterenkovii TaxID=47847 RepID=UPI0038991760